jgi:calcium binding protein 39
MTSFLNSIGKRKKSPEQLVLSTKQTLQSIVDYGNENKEEKLVAIESLNKYVADIKSLVHGKTASNGKEDSNDFDEEKSIEISKYIQSENLFYLLISTIETVSFETRKDTTTIFNYLLRKNVSGFVLYLENNGGLVEHLIQGYEHADSALSCGAMLRESIRYESLSRMVINSPLLWRFFETYVHLPNFEVASDAFNTLREAVTTPKHKHVSEEFLENNSSLFLEKFDVRCSPLF